MDIQPITLLVLKKGYENWGQEFDPSDSSIFCMQLKIKALVLGVKTCDILQALPVKFVNLDFIICILCYSLSIFNGHTGPLSAVGSASDCEARGCRFDMRLSILSWK